MARAMAPGAGERESRSANPMRSDHSATAKIATASTQLTTKRNPWTAPVDNRITFASLYGGTMKSAHYLLRAGACVAALLARATPGLSADHAVGVAVSPGGFYIDSAIMWNSSTVFDNSSVETFSTPCTIRLDGGGKVEVGANSAIQVGGGGLVLERGDVRIEGRADVGITAASIRFIAVAQPAAMKALISGDMLSVEVWQGSAEGVGGHEKYAVLTPGTRMDFPRDGKQPAGVDLLIRGCMHKEKDRWYIDGIHVAHKVEVTGEIPRQSGRPVEVLGILLPMTGQDASISARIRVLFSHSVDGGCS